MQAKKHVGRITAVFRGDPERQGREKKRSSWAVVSAPGYAFSVKGEITQGDNIYDSYSGHLPCIQVA